jgi:hypothetical protein
MPAVPVAEARAGSSCVAGAAAVRDPSLAGATPSRTERVAGCVGRWIDGEIAEFKDGVKRSVGEFRAGYEKVRGALERMGSKLR